VSSAVYKHVRPIALLVYDPSRLAIVCRPLSGGFVSEALNIAESGILNGDYMDIWLVYERCVSNIKM
jgi:hypothetical protein